MKIAAIEDFDREVVGRGVSGCGALGPVVVMVAPEHYTPVEVRTHTTEPVPFAVCRLPLESGAGRGPAGGFNEPACSGTGLEVKSAHRLLPMMVRGDLPR